MKKIVLLLSFLVVMMSFITIDSNAFGETFADDFTGQVISPMWKQSTSNGGVISQDDKLLMDIVDQPNSNARVVFKSRVIGNFDIRIDYTDLNLVHPGSNQVAAYLGVNFGPGVGVQMERTNGVWGNRYIASCTPLDGRRSPCWSPTWTHTTATSGTFRIIRERSLITLIYNDDEGKSKTYSYYGSSEPGSISLRLYSHTSHSSNSHVSWNNFRITADAFDPPPIEQKSTAASGTSLDMSSKLQLDGSLSSDSDDDPLTFSWQIEGEATPRSGEIVSIADLPVGNYKVVLTVSDGELIDSDTMLFGVPAGISDDTMVPTGAVHAHDNMVWPPNNEMVIVALSGYVNDELSIARDGEDIGIASAYLLVDGNKIILRDETTDLLDVDGEFSIEIEVKAVKDTVYNVELYATDTEPEESGGPNSGLVDSTYIRIPHNIHGNKSGK